MFVCVYLHSDPCVNTGMDVFRCMCVIDAVEVREQFQVLSQSGLELTKSAG